jgi:hypothetical protein
MEDVSVEPPPSSDLVFHHASGILSIVTLLFSVLLIFTYGTGAAFRAVRAIFTACILMIHAVSIAKFFFGRSYCQKDLRKLLFLSPDVHSLTIFLLFSFADLTPILTIINYSIHLAVTALDFVVADILPFLGQSDNEAIETARRFTTHQAVTVVPICLEIALIFQLFVIAVADWSLINVTTFVAYIAWVVMFNYAVSQQHRQVWRTIAEWVGARVDTNRASYGPVIERIVGWVATLGKVAIRWYQ